MLGRYTTGPRPSAESSIPPPERQSRALDPLLRPPRLPSLTRVDHAEGSLGSGTLADGGPPGRRGEAMVCASCGTTNAAIPALLPGVRHGARGRRARTVASSNEPNARFCGSCGVPIAGGASAPVRDAAPAPTRAGPGRRAAGRVGPVRGPGRLHDLRRGARRGGRARDAHPVLRARDATSSAATGARSRSSSATR